MASINRDILRLAVPAIVTNITVPLLGLVDVAIVGHIGDVRYIGAIAIGSMIFNIIYWVFGFLRMGTSGLTAQAFGAQDTQRQRLMMARAMVVALAVALIIMVARHPLLSTARWVLAPPDELWPFVKTYFYICVWGAPAMLSIYALTGWFIGMQDTRTPMMVSIFQNVTNIVLSLFLVVVLHWKIEGVAWGTLLAQYAGAVMALFMAFSRHKILRNGRCDGLWQWSEMVRFFAVNRDIFFRTLFLVAVNLFFLSQGSRQGTLILAVNTLLMQLFTLFSYIMDGFAYAGEALAGRFVGARQLSRLKLLVRQLFIWGGGVALFFTLMYAVGGGAFLALLTDEHEVVSRAMSYLPWAVAIPLAGVATFVWDGVFIGLTATQWMLLSAVMAAILFFLIFWWAPCFTDTNHSLWLAFIVFLLMRGVVQTVAFCSCSTITGSS